MRCPRWHRIDRCRACGSEALDQVFSFGDTPISDRLASAPNNLEAAPLIPLELVYCGNCCLLQLSVSVAPDCLYDAEYPYFSSVSPGLSEHFRQLANTVIAEAGIRRGSLVVEAASNDGCLLRHFKAAGADVQGFDPATGPALRAIERGLPTEMAFFGLDTARSFVATRGQADLFLATNVLAHVHELADFAEAIASVLSADGLAVIEVPYLADLVEKREFDTVYHQHLCYFSVTSLLNLFARHDLTIRKSQRVAAQGGSLRLFVVHGETPGDDVRALLRQEQSSGVHRKAFADRIGVHAREVRDELSCLLARLRSEGRKVAGYGAAAKATSLLSWCGFDSTSISIVGDLNPVKHGKYMPGTDIEIVSPEALLASAPDFIVVFAWNLADEIMAQLSAHAESGGRFIIPIPELRIV